eukprot:11188154-Lingulodinium_polyedra.AAC.1
MAPPVQEAFGGWGRFPRQLHVRALTSMHSGDRDLIEGVCVCVEERLLMIADDRRRPPATADDRRQPPTTFDDHRRLPM